MGGTRSNLDGEHSGIKFGRSNLAGTRFQKYSGQFAMQESTVDQDLAALQKLFAGSGVDTKLVDQSLAEHQKLGAQYRDALKSYDSAKPDSCFVVDKLVKGIDRPATDAIDAIVQQVQQFEADTTKASEEHFRQQTARIQLSCCWD